MALGKRRHEKPLEASSPQSCDAKLRRVAHEPKNLTRNGELFASGACERIPFPGLAFKGDEGELLLPLRKDERQKIKESGVVTQRRDEDGSEATAWDVDGELLDVHNERWHAFLDEHVTLQREALAIAPTGTVDMYLRVLVEAGGRLEPRQREEARRNGAFASLLVVLPGVFDGGELEIQRRVTEGEEEEDDHQDSEQVNKGPMTWRPGVRGSPYDLSYAVMFDNCEYVTAPVTTCSALCLVYDLTTQYISGVPFGRGAHQFLYRGPEPLAKKFKVISDVWRPINSFAMERCFAYLIEGDDFDDLYGDERKIADSLAAFCAKSGGEYVLYLTEAQCARTISSSVDGEEILVTLNGAWLKYGEIEEAEYPSITLRYDHDVAPLVANANKDLNKQSPTEFPPHALVVLPASIERRQIASRPIATSIAHTKSLLLNGSREEAAQLARRVLYYRSEWRVDQEGWPDLAGYCFIIEDFEEFRLFNDLLRILELESKDTKRWLASLVGLFGWEACAASLHHRVKTSPMLKGRILLIRSVVYTRILPSEFGPLIDAVLSMYPWTDVNVGRDASGLSLHSTDFASLIYFANLCSQEKAMQAVSIKQPEIIHRVVVPAAIHILEAPNKVPSLRPVLLRVWELYKLMVPELDNNIFADFKIKPHCNVCQTIQAFLRAPVTETTIECRDEGERNHIEFVVRSQCRHVPAIVKTAYRYGELCVRLVKESYINIYGAMDNAKHQEEELYSLLFLDSDVDDSTEADEDMTETLEIQSL